MSIIEDLKKELEGFKREIKAEKVGRVIEVGDGIAKIGGLPDVAMQEMLQFETQSGIVEGIVFNLEEDQVGAIILGNDEKIKEGDKVTHHGRILSVEVGDNLIGRVVDGLGRPLDNKGALFTKKDQKILYPIERTAPSVIDREPVTIPLHTGIKAIDSMIPIGRGQRELIIGDRGTGKTSIALDSIINQKKDTRYKTPICIYVSIGQKESRVAKIIADLTVVGAMEYSIIVSASASTPASLRYLAPYTATAIGEYFMHKGNDVLIVYDDLSKHAVSYREISLLLRRPPGREAYPGDIFYLHSRLLERSAKLNPEKGSGSMTALPIVETQLGDVSAYIPTNVISITDGQIYLESDLFNKGTRPAINPGLSVSRVGSSAQTKAMKKVASKLRLELAQYRELAAFSQFASELEESTRKTLERGTILSEILKQPEGKPMPFYDQVIVIFAATNGYLAHVPVQKISETAADLLSYMHKLHENCINEIEKTGELTKENQEVLIKALEEFKSISKDILKRKTSDTTK